MVWDLGIAEFQLVQFKKAAVCVGGNCIASVFKTLATFISTEILTDTL